jgi:hypothetical protein
MADQNTTRWYTRPAWQGFALACAGIVLADTALNGASARLPWHGVLILSLVGAVVAARRETAKSKSPGMLQRPAGDLS